MTWTEEPQRESRPLPQAHEAEQGVLSCLLQSADAMAACVEAIKQVDEFYDLRHQAIYGAMLELYDGRKPLDLISLQGCLKDKQQLDQVGGLAYLQTLPDISPSPANLPYYLSALHEKAQLRRLLSACSETVTAVYSQNPEAQKLIEQHEQEILALMASQRHTQQLTIKQAVAKCIDKIEELHLKKGSDGIPTGFVDFDTLTCGLHNEDMIVVAGRPSAGKTAFAMNVAEHVSVDLGLPVGVFSLEMSTEALVMRMLCARARVDAQRVRQGQLWDGDFPKLTTAAAAIAKAKLYIDDTPGMSVMQLRSKARRMHQLYGIRLLVIDYLQLLHGSGKRYGSRQEEVSAISGSIKALARELRIPVIILSQLNRDGEKAAGKNTGPRKPRSSDLRDSGAVEQDADVIALLWKPDDQDDAVVELVLDKQRNGPKGDIRLIYLKENTRFVNAARA